MNPLLWLRIINYFRGSGEDASEEVAEEKEISGSIQQVLDRLETNWEKTITDIDSTRGEKGLQHKIKHGNILEQVYATIVFFLVSKDIYRIPQLLAIAYFPAAIFGLAFEGIGGLIFLCIAFGIPISIWFEYKAIEYLKGESLPLGHKIVSIILSLTIIGVYYYHITYNVKFEEAVDEFVEQVVEENDIYIEEDEEIEKGKNIEEESQPELDTTETNEVDTTNSALRDGASNNNMKKPKTNSTDKSE